MERVKLCGYRGALPSNTLQGIPTEKASTGDFLLPLLVGGMGVQGTGGASIPTEVGEDLPKKRARPIPVCVALGR